MVAREKVSRIFLTFAIAWFLFLTLLFYYYRERTTGEIFLLFLLTGFLIAGYELYRRLKKRIKPGEVLTQPITISVAAYVGVIWSTVIVAIVFMIGVAFPPEERSLVVAYAGVIRSISSIIGAWALFTFCWYSLGRFIVRSLRLESQLTGAEKGIYSLGLGLVVCGLYFYFAALLHLLTLGALILFFTISISLGLLFWREFYQGLFRRLFRVGVATVDPDTNFLTALLLLLSFIVFTAFLNNGGYYIIRGDELRTYINVPATYLAHGGLVSFPYDLHNNSSNAFAFIYAPLLMVREDLLNFASLFFYIATVLTAGLIAYQLKGKSASYWAMFLTATTPWSFSFLIGSKVDFMVSFIVIAGIAALFHAWRAQRSFTVASLLAISGFLIGFGGMIKYSALLAVPIVLILSYRGLSAWTMLERTAFICFYGLCIGMIMFPWAMRSMLETGNPTYPYGSYELGYFKELSPQALATYEAFYDYKVAQRQVLNTINPWWKNIWIVMTNQSMYPGNSSGVVFFGLLPGIVLCSSAIRQQRRIWMTLAMLIASVFIMWLFTVTLQLWYVMYIFPLWCVLYAPLIAEKFDRRLRVLIVSVLFVVFMEPFAIDHYYLVQYYTGAFSRKEYTGLLGESNEITEYLNNFLLRNNPDYVIFPVATKGLELLITDNHKHYFNYNFDPASYRIISTWILFALKHETDNAMLIDMRKHGITHILYDQEDMDAYRPTWCDKGEDTEMCLLYDRLTGRFHNIIPYLTVVRETSGWTIYSI